MVRSVYRLHSLALLEPDLGYYQTRQPFGTRGDFITAPEISGLFGEMCGLYIANLSEIAGLDDAGILELGPGRGNLMEDMRHVWKQLDSDLAKAPVHFVEISPNLKAAKKPI